MQFVTLFIYHMTLQQRDWSVAMLILDQHFYDDPGTTRGCGY